jgi:hypothetical protein
MIMNGGNSLLIIVCHLLSDPDARYRDLGAGFHESRSSQPLIAS